MKLTEHINDTMDEFFATMIAFEETTSPEKKAIERPKLVAKLLKQSLKSIAYKSIDAVRVEERSSENVEHPYYERFCEDDNVFNDAIQKSAQKEKEFKGV